jgi:hypothetical protein
MVKEYLFSNLQKLCPSVSSITTTLFFVFIGIIHFLLSTNQVSASASSLRGTSGSTTEDAGVSRRRYEVKRKDETDDK